MKGTAHITIRRADIEDGRPCNTGWCPVARAIRRTTGSDNVCVGPAAFQFSCADETGRRTFCWGTLPEEAQRFIARYDQRETGPLAPLAFDIEYVEQEL